MLLPVLRYNYGKAGLMLLYGVLLMDGELMWLTHVAGVVLMLMAGMWALYEYLRREVPDFEARSDFVYP